MQDTPEPQSMKAIVFAKEKAHQPNVLKSINLETGCILHEIKKNGEVANSRYGGEYSLKN